MRPIFFMHIAKAAGSYLNAVFKQALGKEAVAEHIEFSVGNGADLRKKFDDGAVFFSGHTYLPHWLTMQKGAGIEAQVVTVVRDPIERIASQLRWLDHYNELSTPLKHNKEILSLIKSVAAVDFDDAISIERFLVNLSPTGVQQLDNGQSRYFLGMEPHAPYPKSLPLSIAYRPQLQAALKHVHLVATNTAIDAQLKTMGKMVGVPLMPLPARVNVSPASRSIDTSNPDIRAVLQRRVTLDDWLWRRVGGRGGLQKAISHLL